MRARLHGRAPGGPIPSSGGVRRRRVLALSGCTVGLALAIVVGGASAAGTATGTQTPQSAPPGVRPPLRTRIVALPKANVGNATEQLTVTLSAPPAPARHTPR